MLLYLITITNICSFDTVNLTLIQTVYQKSDLKGCTAFGSFLPCSFVLIVLCFNYDLY